MATHTNPAYEKNLKKVEEARNSETPQLDLLKIIAEMLVHIRYK